MLLMGLKYGHAKFSLTLGNVMYHCDFIVADMGDLPGVLGMDFLHEHAAVMHCTEGLLCLESNKLHCRAHRPGTGSRLLVTKDTMLQPRHVNYVEVQPII